MKYNEINEYKYKIKDFERNANIPKKALSKFTYYSYINSQRMKELLLTMSKIKRLMINNSSISTNKKKKKIDIDGYNTSKLLSNTIKKSQKLLQDYDCYEEIEELEKKKKKKKYEKKDVSLEYLKLKEKTKEIDLKKFKREFDLTNICSTNNKEMENTKKKIKKFLQIQKINNLKEEILMNDQNKKISLNKVYEPKKNLSPNIFFRNNQTPQVYNNIQSRYLDYYNIEEKKYDNLIKDYKSELSFKKKKNILFSSSQLIRRRNIISDSSNELTCSTDKKKNLSKNKSNINKRPLSSITFNSFKTLSSSPSSYEIYLNKKLINKNKGKRNVIVNYINNINKIAINECLNLRNKYLKKSNSINVFNIKKSNIDIDKINKEMKLEQKKNKEINEVELTIKNTKKVGKFLGAKGKKILNETLKKILHDDRMLNKRYYINDEFQRNSERHKRNKNFNKLANETISLEKDLGKQIVPENEKQMIIKMAHELFNNKPFLDDEFIQNVYLKHNIFKDEKEHKIIKRKKHICFNHDNK